MKKSSLIRLEESNIELFGEAAHDNTAGEGVAVRDNTAEETVAISDNIASGEAVRNKIAGGEAVRDNTAGAIVAIPDKIAGGEAVRNKIAGGEAAGDKTAEEGEAILEAADRVDEFIVDPSIEAVLRPKVEGPGIEIDEFERRV